MGDIMVRNRSWSIGRSRGMVTILVVLDKRLVRTGDSLILDISMVLLVLIHKVVNNLGSAVRELHSVLTFHIVPISLLSSRMNIGVAILIIASNIVSKRVVLGSLLMVGFRVMGSMVSWGGHMVGRGSVNHWSRGIGGGWGV